MNFGNGSSRQLFENHTKRSLCVSEIALVIYIKQIEKIEHLCTIQRLHAICWAVCKPATRIDTELNMVRSNQWKFQATKLALNQLMHSISPITLSVSPSLSACVCMHLIPNKNVSDDERILCTYIDLLDE